MGGITSQTTHADAVPGLVGAHTHTRVLDVVIGHGLLGGQTGGARAGRTLGVGDGDEGRGVFVSEGPGG